MKRVLAILAVLAVSQAASAEGRSVTVSGLTPTLGGDIVQKKVVVNYDDLDPADKQGAAALFTRINLVTGALCASNPGGKTVMLADKVEKCRKTAINQAARDIDTAEFSAAASK